MLLLLVCNCNWVIHLVSQLFIWEVVGWTGYEFINCFQCQLLPWHFWTINIFMQYRVLNATAVSFLCMKWEVPHFNCRNLHAYCILNTSMQYRYAHAHTRISFPPLDVAMLLWESIHDQRWKLDESMHVRACTYVLHKSIKFTLRMWPYTVKKCGTSKLPFKTL